jgi:hypothetical protein
MNRNDKMYHRNAVHLLPVFSFNYSTGLLFKTRWETSLKKLEPLPNNSPNFFVKIGQPSWRWLEPENKLDDEIQFHMALTQAQKKSPKESRELKLQHRSRQKW